jgi:hypothetical protein
MQPQPFIVSFPRKRESRKRLDSADAQFPLNKGGKGVVEILYKDLTYKIIGIAMGIHSTLDNMIKQI